MILPPPVTSDCTLADVEGFLDRQNAAHRKETAMPKPAGDEDWDSRDDPPPREPKPTNPSKATDEDDPVFWPWYSAI